MAESTPPDIPVFIVEDDESLRHGLKWMFDASPGFACLNAFGCCKSALASWADAPPPGEAIVVMDINLPGLSGIECTRRIKACWPDIRVLVLTMHEAADINLEAIHAGASGYLIKSTPPNEILEGVRVVYTGGSCLSGPAARYIIEALKNEQIPAEQRFNLTRREAQILRGLVNGLSYRAMAQDLAISVDTVRSHIRTLYKKMGVHSRHEAVSLALQHGHRPV